MRILLVEPHYSLSVPNLGLGYLASVLRKDGHTVKLLLGKNKSIFKSALSSFIRSEKFQIIGIQLMSLLINDVKEKIAFIRNSQASAKIILGGAHVSGSPDSIFTLIPEADYAFRGESETGLLEFIKRFSYGNIADGELDKIPNLIHRRGQKTLINAQTSIEDLDTIPFPAWELMEPGNFPVNPFNGYSRRYPIAPMILTRGCPYRCTFCEAGIINGHNLRSRSAKNVIEEIRFLTSRFGVKEIQFFDSNCAHRQGPLREVCEGIISEGIDITWSAPNGIRIDSIDKELSVLMKQSGCFQVNVGIESGSPRILREIKKGITPDIVKEKVALLRKAGIEAVGFFMIGFPGETATEIKQTISFAMELPLTGASFSILAPLPGTAIYNQVYADTDMESETLGSLDFINYKNNLSEVPYDKLRKIQKNAYLRFHLRPRVFKYFFKNLNSIDKIIFLIRKIYLNAFKS